jgi:nitrogen fixation protein FixH
VKDRSHIVWPGAVILLLIGSVVSTVIVLMASSSDGGVQVVDRYYQKAVAWDSIATVRRTSEALGWQTQVQVSAQTNGRIARLSVLDAEQRPITGLSGSATVSRPQRAEALGKQTLRESDTESGVYFFDFPYTGSGLFDVTVDAMLGQDRYVHRTRLEL